ncbi:hypothetical protein K3495_g15652, partial [Podosphaera aphanis]
IPADFKALVDELKQKLSASQPFSSSLSKTPRSTFATLQGTSLELTDESGQDTPENKGRNDKKRKNWGLNPRSNPKRRHKKQECPCGRGCTTPWSRCYYLMPSAAPSNFEPDPEIVNRIKDLREARPRLDAALRDLERRGKNNERSAGATFYASTFAASKTKDPDHPLARSYIADTGADSHIINSSHRYMPDRIASKCETVASGKDSYPIESIGTATISVRGPKGPVELVLHDVALVPGFFTNIVSISKLSSQGIHMDSGEALLYTNHQGQRRNFAYCPKENGHWILSTRNPIQPSIFSHSTTNEEITQSSRRIHEAMGHLGQKALSLLHTATTGSHFKGRGPTTIECEACALAKAKQLITRTSEKTYPVEAPFQQVNIDLFSFLPDKSRYKYVLILVDSWTGFTMAYSLKSKDASSDAILEALAMIATQFDRKVKSIRL